MKTFNKFIKESTTALITGASSGMGLEYSRQLASSGCNLVIISNQEQKLKETAVELREKYHVNVASLYQDLSTPTAAEEVFDFCKSRNIKIDILINNAGFFFFKELKSELVPNVDSMIRLHCITPTKLCTYFGNEMKTNNYGYILNMSSMAAQVNFPGITLYSATKTYLKSFSNSFYFEMKPYNVGITTICPGAVATPLYGLNEKYTKIGINLGIIYEADKLVNKALYSLFHKKKNVTPGFINHIAPTIIKCMPKKLITKIWVKYRS